MRGAAVSPGWRGERGASDFARGAVCSQARWEWEEDDAVLDQLATNATTVLSSSPFPRPQDTCKEIDYLQHWPIRTTTAI